MIDDVMYLGYICGIIFSTFFVVVYIHYLQNKGYFFLKLTFLRADKSRQALNWTRKHISTLSI